jgi:NADH dehydrogenase
MTQRILVVGTGFAGLWSALGAARLFDQQGKSSEFEIALVGPAPELTIRPRLYEAGAGVFKAPLAELLDITGIRFIQGTVDAIRAEAREVDIQSADGATTTLGYDRLVLATGSSLVHPDIPGLTDHSFDVDQLDGAAKLETHINGLARLSDSPARNTVVVAGGGFSGIETAAEMPARLCAALGEKANIRVVIVERASEIGPDLGPGPRPVIIEALNDLGVEMKLGAAVTAVDADGVTTETGEHIAAKTVIWIGGMRANPLVQQVKGEKDRLGRIVVDRDLFVPGTDGIFATGDAACAATDDDGNHTLMSCQHAIGLGRSAGHNVAASLLGLPSIPYSQPKYVTCLDLGPWGAVFTEGWDRQIKLRGLEAKALKTEINTKWIYPPKPDRAEAFDQADPTRLIVA